MARMDQMLHLIELGLERNHMAFDHFVHSILEEEKKANHVTVAKRIEAMLSEQVHQFTLNPHCYFDTTVNDNMVRGFCYTKEPKLTMDNILLSEENCSKILKVIVEQEKAKELQAEGLEPRHKIILSGPPGNGKTCLAEVIAHEMGIPLMIVRYENLISSGLGDTAKNLYRVMSYAIQQRCVLFFDEFDAIAKSRLDEGHDSTEMKRINLSGRLDRAVWRRFQLHLVLDTPTEEDLWKFYFYYADRENNNFYPDLDMKWLAHETVGFNFAMAKELMETLHRTEVLYGKDAISKSFAEKLIKSYKKAEVK